MELPKLLRSDGKHVMIQAPHSSGSAYYNYKGFHSIVLLAVVDASYRFCIVGVGAYGRTSDDGVLANSAFGMALQRGTADLPVDSTLPGAEDHGVMPYTFVGDAAFPLKRYMMRPYSGKLLPREKRIFNYRLSRARRVVENAFGHLACQWRMYRHVMGQKPETVEPLVKASCILHNFMRWDTASSPSQIDNSHNTASGNLGRVGTNNSTRGAMMTRETLIHYFVSPAGEVSFQDAAL